MRVPSFFTKLYYSRIIRATIATFFSVGKVLSSAGSTLFGVKETLSAYGVNKQAGLGLSSGLTVLNVLLTTANRAPPIYRRLLKAPRLRELAQQQQQQTERYQFLGAPPPLLAIDPTVPSPRLSQEPPPFPDLPPLALSKASLRPALSVEALSPASKFLYYLLSFFGHLSLPFSALNA